MGERIGFIGVGLMGHGMAKNILEKGHAVTVLGHRNREPVEDLVKRGATEAKTAKALAEASDIVILCVTSSAQVESLIRGPEGVAAGARAGMVVVDTSTADPNSTLALAAELAAKGVDYADAPLAATPKEAQTGNLGCMIGASDAVFKRIEPVVKCFASKITHVGQLGDGHKMKLLNNFLSMGYGALYAEAFALAKKVGISPETVNSVISGGRMDCGFYQTFSKWILEGDENAHRFSLSNGHKDMRYVVSMGLAAGAVNPIACSVRNSYAVAEATGQGAKYVPMLVDVVAAQNGISFKK